MKKASHIVFPIYESPGTRMADSSIDIKQHFRDMHDTIEAHIPPGRCRALALTHLETAGMFAVKQIHQGADAARQPQVGTSGKR